MANSKQYLLKSAFAVILGLLAFSSSIFAEDSVKTAGAKSFWTRVENGFSVARFDLADSNAVLKSEVFLLKFDPRYFGIRMLGAGSAERRLADIRTITKEAGGIAGINTNFFDEEGNPLGLLISGGQVKNKMHRGGNVLTGVFYMLKDQPFIIHRDRFVNQQADEAVQCGPRLVIDGQAVPVSAPDTTNRRSGIARTKSGEIILYATFLRFPGATLRQIQKMLLDPALGVTDALNLDGGGSSQLFIERNSALQEDTFISGGDAIPVGLVVTRKDLHS